ncbi:hypothetical protein M878_11755 [Streptomyces roseochromogenus subsp. oscitans DS 12.976]|uniref:Glycoside hydrolase family 3 C-terminal domain-containing protein n=1 Tax=Streptomyces roseochromogenus subsp. oscitans DS 12.976 TaxID=1352936 RepID=V6KPD3_STRRC|nr:hypothetical protein M878_11755 [Streptomyces roseochromogenus subsp. oscitans DS 12.976]
MPAPRALPAHQRRLLRAARAANPHTVLELTSAYPYVVDVTRLPAVLWTAYGGQAAGTALARTLAGDVSPAGSLPQTWYASDADLPDLFDYDVIGARQTYLFRRQPALPLRPRPVIRVLRVRRRLGRCRGRLAWTAARCWLC